MSESFQLITHPSSELTRKPSLRREDPALWSDVDADKLVNLLEDMDGLKHEIHERMRRIEAVKQAKTLLREDAVRTEALNEKLAEMRKAIGSAQPDAVPLRREEADLLHMPARESSASSHGSVVEYSNRMASDSEMSFAQSSTVSHLSPIHQDDQHGDTTHGHNEHLGYGAYQPTEDAPSTLGEISIRKPVDAGVVPMRQDSPAALNETSKLHLEAIQRYEQAQQSATEAATTLRSAQELLTQAQQALKSAHETILESKRAFEQSMDQLNQAISREERAATDLKSTQQELTTAYQFAAVAAQRQHNAAEFFRKTNHWTINAASLSWVATIWIVWTCFHQYIHLWAPCLSTTLVMALAVFMAKWSTQDNS